MGSAGALMKNESSRAEAIMRRELPEQRRRVRIPLHVSAKVRYAPAMQGEHLGLIRDVSVGGLFFYSDFKPRVDSPVHLDFTVPMAGRNVQVTCDGTVVRVETSKSKAIGVAVRMSNLDFLPPASS